MVVNAAAPFHRKTHLLLRMLNLSSVVTGTFLESYGTVFPHATSHGLVPYAVNPARKAWIPKPRCLHDLHSGSRVSRNPRRDKLHVWRSQLR